MGRARLSRHKAILVNKAVQCRLSEEETALVYVFLSFLFDQIQLHSYFSASTIYCLFGEVSLSLSARLAVLPLLSLMPYFIPLAYNRERRSEKGRAVNR